MATQKKKAKGVSKTKSSAKPAKKVAPKKPAAKAKAKPAPKAKVKAKPAPKAKAAKPVKKTVKPVVSKSIKVSINNNGKSNINKLGKTEKKKTDSSSKVNSKSVAPVSSVKLNTPVQPKIRVSKNDNGKTRYSDQELGEFKALIEDKLEAARTELRYLQDQINRKGDNGTDDTENKFSNLEDGSVTLEREYLTQMAGRQLQYLDHLEKALLRIQNKTYGICRVTGKLIEKERLRAVPHATLSMEAKLMQNKQA